MEQHECIKCFLSYHYSMLQREIIRTENRALMYKRKAVPSYSMHGVVIPPCNIVNKNRIVEAHRVTRTPCWLMQDYIRFCFLLLKNCGQSHGLVEPVFMIIVTVSVYIVY